MRRLRMYITIPVIFAFIVATPCLTGAAENQEYIFHVESLKLNVLAGGEPINAFLEVNFFVLRYEGEWTVYWEHKKVPRGFKEKDSAQETDSWSSVNEEIRNILVGDNVVSFDLVMHDGYAHIVLRKKNGGKMPDIKGTRIHVEIDKEVVTEEWVPIGGSRFP